MKNIIIGLVIIFLLPSNAAAKSIEDSRRIEEKKREDLQASELIRSKDKALPAIPIDSADTIYLAELLGRRITYRYDMCKAIVVLMGVENEYIGLNSQISYLREKNLLPKRFSTDFDAEKPLRRGLAAYIFCKVLDIHGGIILRLFGVSERYAIKELAHEGIMASGHENDIISGHELVSILTQAANYKAASDNRKKNKD